MEQFHAAQRRCSAGRLSAQTATGQGSLDHGERRTDPVADAGQPHR